MTHLLEIRDISYTYPGAEKPLLDKVNLHIDEGEIVALMGNNGSGKTTLAMIIAGIVRASNGTVSLLGLDIHGEDYHATPGKVGILFQDPTEGIIATTVDRELAFTLENACIPSNTIKERVADCAESFGIAHLLRRSIDELSGGMLERCALAGVVAGDPSLLILDEPDSFLDFEGRDLLWQKIRLLKESGTAVLFITQSTKIATKCDRKVFLEHGKISDKIPLYNEIELIISDYTCDNNIYQLENICFSYNNHQALFDLNIQISQGERIAILGPSGSGKTTLARVIAGLFMPDSGKINIDKSTRVGICFQFPSRQLFAETVIEDVEFGPRKLGFKDYRKRAEEALSYVGVGEELYRRSPFELSDGQQRWVGIAGVLSLSPDFIIFDEPTASLNPPGKKKFRDIVEALSMQGKTIAIITHDFEFAKCCTQRAIVMRSGRIIYDDRFDSFKVASKLCEMLDNTSFGVNGLL